MQNTSERFWSKADKSGECWEWIASITTAGYGQFYNGTKVTKAHRMAWILTNGEIPNSLHVLHKCDNKKCVNPSHLFLGTNQQNMDDKMSKNRHWTTPKQGELNPNAKTNDVEVLKIRELALTMPNKQIAKKFNIPLRTINEIVSRKTWKHLS